MNSARECDRRKSDGEGIGAQLEQWKNPSINIAVLGKSYSGRSSFINSLISLTSDDAGGAKTGIRNTQENTRYYTHPESDNVKIWEIRAYTSGDPGQYLDRELGQIEHVDIYVLLSVGNFDGEDELATEMKRRDYKVIFVRTKIDGDKAGAYRSKPRTFHAVQIVDTVRDHCSRVLGEDQRVFLVCNYMTNSVDFPDLLCCLVDQLPENKRELLLYCLDGLVRGLGDKKREYLSPRVERVAFYCTANMRCPRVECIIQVDTESLFNEARFYYKQLGLAEKSIQKLEHTSNFAQNHLARPQFELTSGFLKQQFLLSVGNSARTPADHMGECVNSASLRSENTKISYKAAHQFLTDILEKFKTINNDLVQQAERISNQ